MTDSWLAITVGTLSTTATASAVASEIATHAEAERLEEAPTTKGTVT